MSSTKKATFILLTIIVSSCCKSSLIDIISFSESDLKVNPYTGNEILKFVDDSSNIIIYENGYRRINQQEEKECSGGCCDYYLVDMSDNTYFKSTYLESNLQVVILNSFDRYSGNSESPTIHFVWDYYEIKPNVTSTSFGGMLRVDSMRQIATDSGWFHNSFILRGKQYDDVYAIPGYCPYPGRLKGDSLYFSETEGIIGIKFSDGNLWTITE